MIETEGFFRNYETREERIARQNAKHEHPSTWWIVAIGIGMLAYFIAEALGWVE